MVRKKVERKAHALRGELYRGLVLEAAEQEFAEHGFAQARMQRVAEAVGLSVGTVYNLFESKEALYAAVHQQRGSALVQRVMASLTADEPALARLANTVRVHVAFSAEHPNYLRMQLQRGNFWSSHGGHAPGLEQQSFRRGVEAAAALCQAAIRAGELVEEEPRRMVLSFTAVHQAHLQSWLDEGMAETPSLVAERIVQLFERMYGTRGPS